MQDTFDRTSTQNPASIRMPSSIMEVLFLAVSPLGWSIVFCLLLLGYLAVKAADLSAPEWGSFLALSGLPLGAWIELKLPDFE